MPISTTYGTFAASIRRLNITYGTADGSVCNPNTTYRTDGSICSPIATYRTADGNIYSPNTDFITTDRSICNPNTTYRTADGSACNTNITYGLFDRVLTREQILLLAFVLCEILKRKKRKNDMLEFIPPSRQSDFWVEIQAMMRKMTISDQVGKNYFCGHTLFDKAPLD